MPERVTDEDLELLDELGVDSRPCRIRRTLRPGAANHRRIRGDREVHGGTRKGARAWRES